MLDITKAAEAVPLSSPSQTPEGGSFLWFEPLDFCIEWNAENQLIRVCKDVTPCDSDAVALASFKYDPLGRRVEKVSGGVTYSYVYDGSDILQETMDDGVTTTTYRYLHGPGIDEPLAREDAAAGTLTYYHADGLGSITKMTDQAASVVHTYQYDAWGNIEVGEGRAGYAFTGREWDPETGLYYYRARYYDPRAGRFVSEDPIGFAGGMNQFLYVSAKPTSRTDALGLYGEDVHFIRTRIWAEEAGWSAEEAYEIAFWNQQVDESPNTEPWQLRNLAPWHFPTEQRLAELYYRAWMSRSTRDIGRYLHVLQDSYSHQRCETHRDFDQRYDGVLGHAFDGTTPDDITRRPQLFEQMRNDVQRQLEILHARVHGSPGSQ